ncbi:MAG: hypothetical protein ACOCV1_06780 [Bacillota bacterium]
MVKITYNKKLGNYSVTNNGKEYTHATLGSAKRQVTAILNVKKKRAMKKSKKSQMRRKSNKVHKRSTSINKKIKKLDILDVY